MISGYPEQFIEVNRAELRELTGGIPDNDPPVELQVMTRSLAQRIGDLDFVMTSDPTDDITLGASKPSGVVKKSMLVKIKNIVKGDRTIEETFAITDTVDRQGNQLSFSFLPVPVPFYTDEEV